MLSRLQAQSLLDNKKATEQPLAKSHRSMKQREERCLHYSFTHARWSPAQPIPEVQFVSGVIAARGLGCGVGSICTRYKCSVVTNLAQAQTSKTFFTAEFINNKRFCAPPERFFRNMHVH